MSRIAAALVSIVLLTSCSGRLTSLASLEQDLTDAAQQQLTRVFAIHYTRALGKGVGGVVNALARPGGYLDNPLVRILLPPPVMLLLDIARELRVDAPAGKLDVLVNRAAEQAVPGAALILQAAIADITIRDARALLHAGRTAGTEHLQAKTAAALQIALRPLVASALGTNGARQLYEALLEPQPAPLLPPESMPPHAIPEIVTDERPPVGLPDVEALEDYVTEQAVEGLFKELAAEEARIRDQLDSTGLLQN